MSSISGNGFLYDLVTLIAIIAAITTTAIPILYSRVKWEKSIVGRLFMLKTISMSFTVDVALYFRIAEPPLEVRNFFTLIMYTLLAISATLFLSMMWRLQAKNQFNEKELIE